MIVAIAALFGMYDIAALVLIFALNASMILGGMGPVNPVQTPGGKVFASLYALFSGMVFLGAAGVLFAPGFHRFLHRFHLDEEDH
jgi:hypothetical protein